MSLFEQYLREDLAKHGLAVAGGPALASTAASGGASTKPSTTPSTTTAKPAVTSNSPGQRQSYRAPATKPTIGATTGNPRGCLSSLEPVASPSNLPTPPPSSHNPKPPVPSSSGSEPRPAPGKLSASRFNSFQNRAGNGGESSQPEASSQAPPSAAEAADNQEGVAASVASPTRTDTKKGGSGSPRRWTVGPVSSPSAQSLRPQEEVEAETPAAGRNPSEVSDKAGSAAAATRGETGEEEACASVGGLAERFGGIKLKSSKLSRVGSASLSASASEPAPAVEKRTASGRIAELARRFEK